MQQSSLPPIAMLGEDLPEARTRASPTARYTFHGAVPVRKIGESLLFELQLDERHARWLSPSAICGMAAFLGICGHSLDPAYRCLAFSAKILEYLPRRYDQRIQFTVTTEDSGSHKFVCTAMLVNCFRKSLHLQHSVASSKRDRTVEPSLPHWSSQTARCSSHTRLSYDRNWQQNVAYSVANMWAVLEQGYFHVTRQVWPCRSAIGLSDDVLE